MQLREEFSVRVGRRTTQIIRFSLIGLFIMGVAMFTLIFTLLFRMEQITTGMDKMGGHMQNMEGNFIIINQNFDIMNGVINTKNALVEVIYIPYTKII